MPIYEYQCSACGKTHDVIQKMNDPGLGTCESCHAAGTLSRVVSRTSFVLKGGGWYSDLYSSKKKEGGESGGADAAKAAPAAEKTAAAPAAAAPAPAPAPAPKTVTGGDK